MVLCELCEYLALFHSQNSCPDQFSCSNVEPVKNLKTRSPARHSTSVGQEEHFSSFFYYFLPFFLNFLKELIFYLNLVLGMGKLCSWDSPGNCSKQHKDSRKRFSTVYGGKCHFGPPLVTFLCVNQHGTKLTSFETYIISIYSCDLNAIMNVNKLMSYW